MRKYTEQIHLESAEDARRFERRERVKSYGIAFVIGMLLSFLTAHSERAGQAKKVAEFYDARDEETN